jgi:hypothetical protein
MGSMGRRAPALQPFRYSLPATPDLEAARRGFVALEAFSLLGTLSRDVGSAASDRVLDRDAAMVFV